MIIHLLITDWFKGLLPADTPTHADLYKNLFAPVVPDAEYKVYAAMEGELPDLTNPEPGLYVITGSQAGAYETDAWIGTLLQWIRDAKTAGIALSGVCFGAQAIGQALGGRVIKHPNGWGSARAAWSLTASGNTSRPTPCSSPLTMAIRWWNCRLTLSSSRQATSARTTPSRSATKSSRSRDTRNSRSRTSNSSSQWV